MDLKDIIYYWPLLIIGAVLFYIVIEYRRYQQEKQEQGHRRTVSPPALPDKLVLARLLDQPSIEKNKSLMIAIVLLAILLPVFLLVLAVDMNPDRSWSELLQTMVAKFADKPTLFVNFLIMMVILIIAPVFVVAMNKNERLILTRENITYVPPFTGLWKGMDAGWSLRWEEVASIKMARGLMRGQLRIKPLQGKVRVLMSHVWQPVDNSLRPQYKSLFSLMKFRYKLQHDIDEALRHLPLLRYIHEKTGLTIDVGEKSELDFDLLKHPLTRRMLVVLFGLMAYALVDIMANTETYTQTPPVVWFLGSGGVASLGLVFWLWNKGIPVSNVLGLGIMTGGIFAVAMYPGLLRLNQFTGSTSLQMYNYHYEGNYRFTSDLEDLPVIVVKKLAYWDSIKPDDEYLFVLRKGGLGFYQLDMAPVHKKTRVWYCKKHAEGDAVKLSECDKQE